jgi:hypothetical protein
MEDRARARHAQDGLRAMYPSRVGRRGDVGFRNTARGREWVSRRRASLRLEARHLEWL